MSHVPPNLLNNRTNPLASLKTVRDFLNYVEEGLNQDRLQEALEFIYYEHNTTVARLEEMRAYTAALREDGTN